MSESETEIELVIDARAVIGESPLWAEDQSELYWVDIKAPALYRTKIPTFETTSWSLPSDIGGYALTSGGAIVALRSGIFALDFFSGKLAKFCDPPFDPRIHRFNEVDCDPSGRLWLGTMLDPNRLLMQRRSRDTFRHSPAPVISSSKMTAACFIMASPGVGTGNSSSLTPTKAASTPTNLMFNRASSAANESLPNTERPWNSRRRRLRRGRRLLERDPSWRLSAPIHAGRTPRSGDRTSNPEPDHDGLWGSRLARPLCDQRDPRQTGKTPRRRYLSGARWLCRPCATKPRPLTP